MSINVTVKGNPISINRGKMVALDPSSNKKEFDKRRLLRLEQVRQQSKELAEDVRNKVRKEKKKQMGEIEKEGKEKLKSWQNRKLLELQNQYQEALEEIGAGHREAEELENESDLLEEKRMKNEKIAQNRGRNAATKLQVQKNEENYKKAMPLQHKKLVRDIENTRAALVSCLKKKGKCQNRSKKKRKTSADINITIPDESGNDSDSESSDRLTRIQEEEGEDSEEFCECTDCSDEKPSYDASSKADFNGPSTAQTSTKKQEYSDVENTENDSNRPQRQSSSKKSLHSSPDRQKRTSKCPSNQQRDRPKQKSLTESIDDRRKYIEEFVRSRPRDLPSDTRISDRIRHRQQVASQPDFCDEADAPVPEVETSSGIRTKTATRPNYLEKVYEIPPKDPLELSSDECIGCKYNGKFKPQSAAVQADMGVFNRRSNYCSCGHSKENVQSKDVGTLARSQSGEILKEINSKRSRQSSKHESLSSPKINTKFVEPSTNIPFKPAVKLRDVKSEPQRSTVTSAGSKVKHYDFPNRYEGMMPSTSQVERISADSIEVIPNVGSELEWQELMRQRDREAQLRGKRALEKAKIQKDYEEMMKKLPILQRKEHISQIGTDKPEYHMSEERLKRREQERQNMLENAYLQAIPELKPQIVTLPRKKHNVPKTNEPFEILDGADSRTVPLGKWDTESEPKKMFSAEEVQEIIKAFTVQKPEDRKTKLKQLLKSLKLQKEQLLNEIKSLPNDANITSLISDLNSFSDSDDKRRKHKKKDRGKSERKRRREESDASNTSSDTVGRERRPKEKGKHGRSPLKKLKKSRPKVLVLQNTSTQTTPKAKESSFDKQEELYKQAQPTSGKICTKSHTPCDCKKDADASTEEVCKIFIKLKEDESPKVEVVASARDKGGVAGIPDRMEVQRERRSKSPRQAITSPTKQKKRSKSPEKRKASPKERPCSPKEKPKPAATVTDSFKKPLPKEPKKLKPYTVVRGATGKSSSRQRNESWKEHLSKNSMSTTSTSYLSPPDFTKADTTASTEASKLSMYNLRKKPQQTNFNRSSTLKSEQPDHSAQSIDEQLLNYIKRLLSMSKASVDELGVSSSDVQTPTQSVIEMESNNPMAPLHNIIKFINWRAADLARELSISADATPVPPNSVVSEMSICKGQPDESQHVPERDITTSSSSRTRESQMCRQYADFTDSCAERIANLAAMIEKLRDEKNQLMMIEEKVISQKADPQRPQDTSYDRRSPCDRQSPRETSGPDYRAGTPGNSDRENSTRYLDFPPSGEKSKGTNSTASMDEEELNRRLFEIDMSLAEKLKRFRKQKDEKSGDSSGKSDRSGCGQPECPMQSEDQQDEVDQGFLQRLQKLMEETQEKQRLSPEHSRSAPSNDVPFVPLLIDIPKLPILEPAPESLSYDFSAGSEKRHPPPSKGLITAKKFNGNISLVPHELSTIIEADSQLSTRISPDESKTLMSPSRDKVLPLSPMLEEESFPTDKSLGRDGSKQSFSLGEPRTSKGSEGIIKCRDPSIPSKKSPNKLNRRPTLEEESFPIDKELLRIGSRHSTALEERRSSKDPEVKSRDPSMTSNKTSSTKSNRSAEKPSSFKSLDSSESTKSLSCNDATCNEATCLSLASSITSNKKSSSSSASDMASMEDMLKSIGMDWAIPTLHKTREALALTSSSSSGNVSSRRKSRDKSNASSEVSLKDFLKKQISAKISSSSLRSDASPASFCQDCSEISAIQANSSTEKGKQRTSTPVLVNNSSSKSKEDQQQLFTGASDISSVRNSCSDGPCSRSTGKQTFHTVGGEDDMSSKSSTE